jgi:hypothetical protein
MRKLLAWSGGPNAYAGFDKLLDASSEGGMALSFYADEWRRFTESGPETRFVGPLFQPPAGTERIFCKVLPDEFRLKSDLSIYGAVVEQLPRPSVEMESKEMPSED